jgi:hypothetical protein
MHFAGQMGDSEQCENTEAPESSSQDIALFQSFAESFPKKTSAKAIKKCLTALIVRLGDPLTANPCAQMFMQAGGLPVLIRHLRGEVTMDARQDTSIRNNDISSTSGKALAALLSHLTPEEFDAPINIMSPLISALRDAPAVAGRSAAAQALLLLVNARPEECRTLAEAGVVQIVLAYDVELSGLPDSIWTTAMAENWAEPASALVCALIQRRNAAAQELCLATQAKQVPLRFAALIFLQVCHSAYTHKAALLQRNQIACRVSSLLVCFAVPHLSHMRHINNSDSTWSCGHDTWRLPTTCTTHSNPAYACLKPLQPLCSRKDIDSLILMVWRPPCPH